MGNWAFTHGPSILVLFIRNLSIISGAQQGGWWVRDGSHGWMFCVSLNCANVRWDIMGEGGVT